MRKLIRRLASTSCSSCRDRVSHYATGCADCGADLRSSRTSALSMSRDRALVWLLGGAVAGCLMMLVVGPH
jgi:predicted amidophosphoribosyltransferase